MEEQEKITLSEQIIYALVNPKKYEQLLQLKKGRFISFALLISFVVTLVTTIVPVSAIIAGFGGFENLFTKQLGNISYADGKLQLDKPFEMSVNDTTVIIDTSEEMVPDEKLSSPGIYVAIGSKYMRMVMSYDGKVENYQVAEFQPSAFPQNFSNAFLCELIPYIYGYLVFFFIAEILLILLKYVFISLLFSVCANLFNKRLELDLSFGEMFKICFYGQTFAIVLTNFNRALGILPDLIVSMVGMFITVHMITASLIELKAKQ